MFKKFISLFLALVLMIGTIAGTGITANAETTTTDKPIIALDPGHGLGGTGNNDYGYAAEGDLALKVAQYIQEYLADYYVDVKMTRTTRNENPTLEKRTQIAQSYGASLVFSIHFNASGSSAKCTGACVLVPSGNYRPDLAATSKTLADAVLTNLHNYAGLKNRGKIVKYSQDGSKYPDGSKRDYYGIIQNSIRRGMAAVIVEHCFLDNYNDYIKYANTDAKLRLLAKADADAIISTLNLKTNAQVEAEKAAAAEAALLAARGKTAAEKGDAPFTDVREKDWYYASVIGAYNAGLFSGNTATTFNPSGTLTREQFIVVLARMLNVDLTSYKGVDTGFTDVPASKWCASAIAWAHDWEIVSGYSDGRFGLGEHVTRAQIAAFIGRVAEICGTDLNIGETSEFVDEASIPAYAAAYVHELQSAGIMLGNTNGYFNPNNDITRAEASSVFLRLSAFNMVMPAEKPSADEPDEPADNAEQPADINSDAPVDPEVETEQAADSSAGISDTNTSVDDTEQTIDNSAPEDLTDGSVQDSETAEK